VTDDELPIPGPPDDMTDAESEAWLRGAATVASILAQQNRILANAYDDMAPNDADPSGAAEGGCDCDAEPIGGMGGTSLCPDCGEVFNE